MAFNLNTIPSPVIDDVAMGLQRDMDGPGTILDALLDDNGENTREEVGENGEIPVVGSEQLLGQDYMSSKEASGTAIDDTLPRGDSKFESNATYQKLRYGTREKLSEPKIDQITQETNMDPLRSRLMKSRLNAWKQIDAYTTTILNNDPSVSVTSWSNASSTPFKNIRTELKNTAGDTLFIGTDRVDDLVEHPDFRAKAGFGFDAGAASSQQIANILRGHFGRLQNVVIGDQFYGNDAEEGQDLTLGWSAAGDIWVGQARGIYKVEDPDSPEQMQYPQPGTKVVHVAWERFMDILRPADDVGKIIDAS